MTTKIGLDLFETRWPAALCGAKVGLVIHPASVDSQYTHAASLFLNSKQCKLTAFFGPQHGIRGETQDNMIEWNGYIDPISQLPVYSLYGETRKPYPDMLKNIDALVVDLQDVGSRYYTFIWTMELCMQACLEQGKSIIILDRPNPINGEMVEGPGLNEQFTSFVGQRSLPIRHGMTIAEIALYLQNHFYPQLDLHVIPMENWKRNMCFKDTGLPWIMPSPNMPMVKTAYVYPGMCLLEGTYLSEGRGTTRPFEIFGAPYIDPDILINELKQDNLPGLHFRPLFFMPTFQKHAGIICGGAQLHVTDKRSFKPVQTAVAVLKTVKKLYPNEKLWKDPPYEYETEKLPIDILSGSDRLRLAIESGVTLSSMVKEWDADCEKFRPIREAALLYR